MYLSRDLYYSRLRPNSRIDIKSVDIVLVTKPGEGGRLMSCETHVRLG